MALSDALSQLRQLLHDDPSPETWGALLNLIDNTEGTDGHTLALDYAQEHLADWPDDLRIFTRQQLPDDLLQTPASICLARTLHLAGLRLDLDTLDDLIQLPLAALSSLDLGHSHVGPDGLATLLGAPWASDLSQLRLNGSQLADRGLHVLSNTHLPRLSYLELASNQIRDAGLVSLTQAPFSLAHLDLSWNAISAIGAEEIALSKFARSLQHLDLTGNPLKPDGAWSLTEDPQFASLSELNLASCRLGDEGASQIAYTPLYTQLTQLDLSNNNLTDVATNALSRSPSGEPLRLKTLNLGSNRLTAKGLARLTASPDLRQITGLDLSANGLGPDAIKALRRSPHLDGLVYLNLSHNNLGNAGARLLSELSDALPALKRLDLSANRIDQEGAQLLANAPILGGLNLFRLSRNRIGRWGHRALLTSEHLSKNAKRSILFTLDPTALRDLIDDLGLPVPATSDKTTLTATLVRWLDP